MSDKNKKTLEHTPEKDDIITPPLPPVVDEKAGDNKISLATTRLECIKLTHSAGKSVFENLSDAEVYLKWITTGEKQNQNTLD